MQKAAQGVWFVALLGLLISCLAASWLLNAKFYYGYGLWYDWLSIDQHIQQFGPENYSKHGFELLPKAEHVRVFNDISQAVHQHGQGLADISYAYQGRTVPLLTKAEIIHLQDVANLIDQLEAAALVIAVFTAVLLVLLRNQSPPRWQTQLLLLLGLVAACTAVVLMIGATKVFYQLHIWIFPDDHQWFFYYQESLMSTLMKAPDLFAGIAVAILAGAILLQAVALVIIYQFVRTPPVGVQNG